MAVPDQVKTKTNKNKSATKKTMSKGATTGSQVGMSMLIPVVGLKAVSATLAAKGATAAVKKFGPNLVKAAKKYFNPVKTQRMKTGRGRGTPGNKNEMEDAFVVYKKGPLSKTKKGNIDMGMKKVTKAEGEKMLAKGAARKVGLGTVAAATGIGVGSSLSTDKKEPKETTKVKENINRVGTVDEFGGGKTPPKPKANPRNKSDSETVSDTQKKETQLGTKKAKEADTKSETRRQKSQLNKTKSTLKPLEQGIRKYKTRFGEFTVDSTDEGMRNPEDDLNLYKGGMAFGKGGMYKGAKKTYGMKNGGFTRRGMGK